MSISVNYYVTSTEKPLHTMGGTGRLPSKGPVSQNPGTSCLSLAHLFIHHSDHSSPVHPSNLESQAGPISVAADMHKNTQPWSSESRKHNIQLFTHSSVNR